MDLALLENVYQKNIKMIQKNKSYQFFSSQKLGLSLKEAVRVNRKTLVQRYLENEAARRLGFLVYAHGAFYERQYGRGSFLYLERFPLPDGLESVSAWRENYPSGRSISSKMTILVKDVSFAEAFGQAARFITWLNKKQGIARLQQAKPITLWEMD
ncbi:MAG: hypothetical protein ABF683_05610 [Sporolactobacillus sp.]